MLIVVDKPAGMVVHPAAGHGSGTLVNALLHHVSDLSGIGGELRPGIVHRLDRGTSGLMVVAKRDAHEELSRQFHDREVEKEYIALVWGRSGGTQNRRADWERSRNRKKMSARARRSREAVTRIVQCGGHSDRCSRCAHVAIQTGRTHQIRVHLSAIGHPVVGDSTGTAASVDGCRATFARGHAPGPSFSPCRPVGLHPPIREPPTWNS